MKAITTQDERIDLLCAMLRLKEVIPSSFDEVNDEPIVQIADQIKQDLWMTHVYPIIKSKMNINVD